MMKIWLLVLASACVVMGVPQDAKFRYKNCLNKRVNRIGENCHNSMSESNQLSSTEKQIILEAVNLNRYAVANGQEKLGNPGPQPTGLIPELKWDDDLANDAYRWAKECKSEVDPCLEPESMAVGQTVSSVAHANQRDSNVLKMFHGWYDEVKNFDKNLVTEFTPDEETLKKISNYSQIVWGKTTKIGCGKSVDYDGKLYRTTFVCNYYPAGNIINQSVYKVVKIY